MEKVKLIMLAMWDFVKKHRLEIVLLIIFLVIGAWLRLFRISEYMTFLGDEGRDARVVRNLVVHADPVLIGPMTSVVTSAGHMYLGPLYYYLIAPALLIFGLSPVGPSVMVALISLLTLVMIWWLGRNWWGPIAGLSGAALFAVSPTVIIYSRSSWNPNVMPFFALLVIWSVYEFWVNKKFKWLLLTGGGMAFVLQTHYLGLMLVPVVGIFWLITLHDLEHGFQVKGGYLFGKIKSLLRMFRLSVKKRRFWQYSIWGMVIWMFLMSPLVIFDARHGWLNSRALWAFFTERQTTVHLKFYDELGKFYPILEQIFASMLTVKNLVWAKGLLTVLGAVLGFEFFILFKNKKRGEWIKKNQPLVLVLVWILVGVGGLMLYQQTVFDHYFGFLYPAVFLLVGWMVDRILKLLNTYGKCSFNSRCFENWQILVGGMMLALIYFNLQHSPLIQPPNRQLQKTEVIVEKIISESHGEPFNIALIARHNYDEAYRYILEWREVPVVMIDPANAKGTITKQLFVICENQPPFKNRDDDCNPIAHPKSEIALFGWAKIANEWDFDWGTKLYKLVHTEKLN